MFTTVCLISLTIVGKSQDAPTPNILPTLPTLPTLPPLPTLPTLPPLTFATVPATTTTVTVPTIGFPTLPTLAPFTFPTLAPLPTMAPVPTVAALVIPTVAPLAPAVPLAPLSFASEATRIQFDASPSPGLSTTEYNPYLATSNTSSNINVNTNQTDDSNIYINPNSNQNLNPDENDNPYANLSLQKDTPTVSSLLQSVTLPPTARPPQPWLPTALQKASPDKTQLINGVYNIKIGLIFEQMDDDSVGFSGSAGAISIALDQAKAQGLINNINVTFEWQLDTGNISKATGFANSMMYDSQVHAIFGPTKIDAQNAVAALASYQQIPHFVWGRPCPYAFKENPDRYNSTAAMSGTTAGSIVALIHVCAFYQWSNVAFLNLQADTISSGYCGAISDSIDSAIQKYSDNKINLVFKRELFERTIDNYKKILLDVSEVARVIILCFDVDTEKRAFMLAASENNMINNDYVYIMMQSGGTTYNSDVMWIANDGRDKEAQEAFKSTLIIDKPTGKIYSNYTDKVVQKIKEFPWLCTNCTTKNASTLSYYLGDAVLAYLTAINRTIKMYEDDPNLVTSVLYNSSIVLYQLPEYMNGIENDLSVIKFSRVRAVNYALYGLGNDLTPKLWADVSTLINISNIKDFTPTYTNPATSIWATRKGHQPLNEPECGYQDNKCTAPTWAYVLVGVACSFLFVAILLLFLGCIFWFRRVQQKRLNALWQVDYHQLEKMEETSRSGRSMSSFTISNATIDSLTQTDVQYRYFNHEIVTMKKFPPFRQFSLRNEAELREMRQLDHPHLNRFLGLTQHGPSCYTIFRYCERGTVENVIMEYDERIDGRIISSMVANIVEGLYYLHNSKFGALGCLNAESCLVDDRFQVKLQYYGMTVIKQNVEVKKHKKKALYISPELLRRSYVDMCGTKPGDIYSLGVLLTQMYSKQSVWQVDEKQLDINDIVKRVIKGTEPLERPSLEFGHNVEYNEQIIFAIKSCLLEDPDERPEIKNIKNRLQGDKTKNLMDYMFALMENTANELEQQVQQRTAELAEEQKKANLLLYRMMPKAAVDVLRNGESVEPQVFRMATVFFSDIVSFTVLSSKSTPLQIINFLNQVYTMTDDVIERHDVYKVETIGDGLHCVSGIPIENGENHVKEICDMAIGLQKGAKTLHLAHLPNEKVQLRLGVHSGACVTGIVGMTAPRYCVFGDTVNLAAKMESTGKPGQIHLSPTSKLLIDQHFPKRYHIVSRGEVLIKNRGSMHTYWVVPPGETIRPPT
ncbi:unnamed protein product [Bursaphelenchus okinawaensis]|uniref:Guanylate cyclase n=1 Tax=Bursaphelenchus okinawaensis TaxID=465554 RepID=A0A811LCR4_9BILA|nr:unnamed protein product [Bursaphelenchus okinawaensis]CAG9120934.1 unnamed protein product [Bursaphelenchus okinawaensis]